MANIANSRRSRPKTASPNYGAFAGGDEYDPPTVDDEATQEPGADEAVQDSRGGAASANARPESKPSDATSAEEMAEEKPQKPIRKNWVLDPTFIQRLAETKSLWIYEGYDEGRAVRYDNKLAEQVWMTALATYAMELLDEDLKKGPNHGLAGKIHTYFPKNSRAVRGYT